MPRPQEQISLPTPGWAPVLLKLSLCSLVPNRNLETEFWVK